MEYSASGKAALCTRQNRRIGANKRFCALSMRRIWQHHCGLPDGSCFRLSGIEPVNSHPLFGGVVYRCEARSKEAFVQQIAISYVLNGYFFYVVGRIPDGKAVERVDAKLADCYGLHRSKWVRARRKKMGLANVQYLRVGKSFVLVATEGKHEFFKREGCIRDIREHPIRCFGYEVKCYQRSSGRWHPSVAISPKHWRNLRRWFRDLAILRSREELAEQIGNLPFAPFAAVQRQCRGLVRMVNRRRRLAALPLLDPACVRNRRKPVKVFGRLR